MFQSLTTCYLNIKVRGSNLHICTYVGGLGGLGFLVFNLA
jgi:hypothetical protein